LAEPAADAVTDAPAPPLDKRAWFWARVIGWILEKIVRLRVTREGPKRAEGAALILGNHCATMDPGIIFRSVGRPVQFMATEQVFRAPRVGVIAKRLGAFPKAKYARDREAIAKVMSHTAAGHAVCIFPEGNRSWDGRTQPLQPGLGWLIKKLDGPVVFVRNLTGWAMHPRWARYPRLVPTLVECSEPFTFPSDWSTRQIEEEVARRIHVDPDGVEVDGFTFGYRMAEGLPVYLWACPACFALDALAVHPTDGHQVACRECDAAWRLDVLARLHPVGGGEGGEALSVAVAFDRITGRFGELPTVDQDRFVAEGVALEGVMRVLSVDGDDLEVVAEGPACLRADALTVGDEPWRLPLKEMKAISLEFGGVLQVRTADALYQLEPLAGSPLKWRHFLAAHHTQRRSRRRSRR